VMKDSYKDMTLEELAVKREELKKQYNDARFNAIIGHVDNPLAERELRRRLARVYTIMREFDLGIRGAERKKTAPDREGAKSGAKGKA
jgi:large subunit ribosomal protein L29